jgi:hypothetical protein
MVSITHCWKRNWRIEPLMLSCAHARRSLIVWLLWAWCIPIAWAATPVELQTLKVERFEHGVYASANLQFELPAVLEEAMFKGVSLYFVTEIDIFRERWYFYDQRVSHAERHVRVTYMPLTRRWRVNISAQPFSATGLGMNLGQSHDSLEEALGAVRRIVQWRVAMASDVEVDGRQSLEFSFKLDLNQLPRPLQIGAAGQSDWNIKLNKSQRLVLEPSP